MTNTHERQQLADQVDALNAHFLHGWMTMHVRLCGRRGCQICAELRRGVRFKVESDQATKGAA